MLFALRAFGDGLSLSQCPMHVLRHEAANLTQRDVLILIHAQQVPGERSRAAPLRAFEDHHSSPWFAASLNTSDALRS